MGVDDVINFVLLMEHFFESQMKAINHGSKRKYLERDATIEQNNTSAIQLKHNGWKLSSSTQTKDHEDEGINRVICKPTAQGKKSLFLKVFKVAGKKCITTVSKENFEKKK